MPTAEQASEDAEANRRRYEELKAAAAERSSKAFPPPTPRDASVDATAVISKTTIPGGWYTSLIVKRGERLRLVNVDGTAAVSLLAWNTNDTSERFSHADTIKVQWTAALHNGRVLFSDMGRILFSIVEDTCGAHDVLTGGSNAAGNAAKYRGGPHRNTRDNFILAVSKHGLGRPDIPPCVTFFAPTSVAADGALTWAGDRRHAGDFVELRAEMDAIVVVSNCPHPLDPAKEYQPGPVEMVRLRASAISPHDLCRTATAEAVRGFENTDAMLT